MNILFICNEYPPFPHGGIGSAIQILARGLHVKGHTIIIAGFYSSISSVHKEIDQGIVIYRIPKKLGRFSEIRSRLHLFFFAKKIIRAHSIDIIEAPDYLGAMAFWPRLSIPIVVRIHGSCTYLLHASHRKIDRRIFFFESQTLRKASLLVAVSKSIAERTLHLFTFHAPMQIIYNSISCTGELDRNREPRDLHKVIFTGTLMKIKGVFSLFAAWPAVVEKIPRATLHLFGKDSLNEHGESIQSLLVQRLDPRFHDTIVFYGHIDRQRILQEFKTASVAVLPSLTEAFALAPLEAMAQGCPTVYTKLASGPEVIDNGKNGILIDPNNPAEIAETIITLLTDRNLAEKIGAEGRKSVENRFTNATIIPQNEKLYASCIHEYAQRRSRTASRTF